MPFSFKHFVLACTAFGTVALVVVVLRPFFSDPTESFTQRIQSGESLDAIEIDEPEPENSISNKIQVAWKKVVSAVPEERGSAVFPLNQDELIWFVDLIETENSMAVPLWWREVVLSARAYRRDNIRPGQPRNPIYHRSGVDWVHCPLDVSFEVEDGIFCYTSGTESSIVPADLIDKHLYSDGRWYCNICCAFTARFCFVAIHGYAGSSHDVVCIDRETNEIMWKSNACGCMQGIMATGMHESYVSLVPTVDGRIFVFGYATVGFYVHGFDCVTGETLFEFSNNLDNAT